MLRPLALAPARSYAIHQLSDHSSNGLQSIHCCVPCQELHTAQEDAAGHPKQSAPFSAIVILYLDSLRAVPAAQTPPYLRLEAALFFPEQSKPSTNISASNPDEPASFLDSSRLGCKLLTFFESGKACSSSIFSSSIFLSFPRSSCTRCC